MFPLGVLITFCGVAIITIGQKKKHKIAATNAASKKEVLLAVENL